VPLAKSGYRPTIAAVGSVNYASQAGTRISTGSFGVEIRQTLFDGFQTKNNVRAAEARVRAANEALRNTEQNTLFNAAAAYMDVIRDRQIAALRERNLAFLKEQVRAARSRFEVGEGTRTDVAQARSRALGRRRPAVGGARGGAVEFGRLPPGDRRRSGASCVRPAR
jgi:outer membrane protein